MHRPDRGIVFEGSEESPVSNRPAHNRDASTIAAVTVMTPTTSMMAPLAIIARNGTLPEP